LCAAEVGRPDRQVDGFLLFLDLARTVHTDFNGHHVAPPCSTSSCGALPDRQSNGHASTKNRYHSRSGNAELSRLISPEALRSRGWRQSLAKRRRCAPRQMRDEQLLGAGVLCATPESAGTGRELSRDAPVFAHYARCPANPAGNSFPVVVTRIGSISGISSAREARARVPVGQTAEPEIRRSATAARVLRMRRPKAGDTSVPASRSSALA
jgi:hypothetical protein